MGHSHHDSNLDHSFFPDPFSRIHSSFFGGHHDPIEAFFHNDPFMRGGLRPGPEGGEGGSGGLFPAGRKGFGGDGFPVATFIQTP